MQGPLQERTSAMDQSAGTVLVVEDDPTVAEQNATVLREFGAVVFQAASVRAACRILDQRHVDLVLTDYHLTDGTAQQLLDSTRETARNSHWILFSAAAGTHLQAGADSAVAEVLSKPVDTQTLKDCVSRSLRGVQTAGYHDRLIKPAERDELLNDMPY